MNTSVTRVLPSALSDEDELRAASLPRVSQSTRRTALAVLGGLLSLSVWIGLWQLASVNDWNFFFRFENIPAPTDVAAAAADFLTSPKLAAHVWSSVRRIFIGYGVASVLAVGLGLLIGRFRLVSHATLPALEVLRPIPAVAWIPLAILLFASAEQSMVFITFIGAFFPVLLNTIHGVETLDRRLLHAAITLGAGPVALFREVILPGAMPSIVTGLSIGMGTSWFSLVTAEMISGQFGIGYYTWEAYTLQNYPNIVLGMISIGLLGMLSSSLIKAAGRYFMPWFKPNGGAA
ncbi:MAG TPA: ABC transporter permease [Polyangiaceae bacterium]|jgi:NitT/TauT family transport system permease protein|nr:ABC transporter permease [Polyangiaceae bacterium]